MGHWYINLEDKSEKHGPARHIYLPEQQAKEWLASLRQRACANKPPRWGRHQPHMDGAEAMSQEK